MTTDKDDLPKHLEFILDVVERHARNSFVLKGWSVTLENGGGKLDHGSGGIVLLRAA